MSRLARAQEVVFLVIPVLGLGLLAAAVVNGRVRETVEPSVVQDRPTAVDPVVPDPVVVPPEPAPPPPAPANDVARAMDEVRLRSTYENFRTAVATGDAALADVLRRALRRESSSALLIAREAVRTAPTAEDRAVSQLALESLER